MTPGFYRGRGDGMSAAQCTCSGDRWPDDSRIVTVGCRVHHVYEDGAAAADHEVTCACGHFRDGRTCERFVNKEDDEEFDVCPECVDYFDKESHVARVEVRSSARPVGVEKGDRA